MKIKNMKVYLAGLMLGTTLWSLNPSSVILAHAEEMTESVEEDTDLLEEIESVEEVITEEETEDETFGDFIPEDTPTEKERKGIEDEPTPTPTPEEPTPTPTPDEPTPTPVVEVPQIVYVPESAPVVVETPKTGESVRNKVVLAMSGSFLLVSLYGLVRAKQIEKKAKRK